MTTKYDILRGYQYRHKKSLLVTHSKQIPWQSKPSKLNVWFLVYYNNTSSYNIEVRVWYNDDRETLSTLVKMAHQIFIRDMNEVFAREKLNTYKDKTAEHLIALEPGT